MLFLTPDNDFAGDAQDIGMELVKDVKASLSA
jgi:ferredoxin-thioredoxin reductase catalytic chain